MSRNPISASPLFIATGTLLGTLLASCIPALAGAQDERAARAPYDAVADAQTPRTGPVERPEQRKTEHDRSDIFNARKARPTSPVFEDQPKEGKISLRFLSGSLEC